MEQVNNERVNKVVRYFRNSGMLKSISRRQYPIDLNSELEIIKQIGLDRKKSFTLDKDNLFTYENIVKWVNGSENFMAKDWHTGKIVQGDLTKGIFIAGDKGTGKSWALEIMNAYIFATGNAFAIGKDIYPLYYQIIKADNMPLEFSQYGDLFRWIDPIALCIQDIPYSPKTGNYMGNVIDVLVKVIEARGDMTRFTHFSSNYRLEQLKVNYGERVVSRLQGMCNYFELLGNDRRATL